MATSPAPDVAIRPAAHARRTVWQRLALLARSVGVGGVASLIDLAVLTLLASGLGLGPRVASPFALLAGLAVQFVGQKLFAFRDARRAWGSQAFLFALVGVGATLLNLVLFDAAVRFVPAPYVALRVVVQLAVYAGFCLPLWSRLFAPQAPQLAPEVPR